MKLITFKNSKGKVRAGWLKGKTGVVDMKLADKRLPSNLLSFIEKNEKYFAIIKEHKLEKTAAHYQLKDVQLLAPIPHPPSIRDFLGFEQHMLNAGKSFGHKLSEVYYDIPVFYFTNHHAVFGPDDEIKRPAAETKMDLELEIAVVMGKKGNDIKVENANDYIFGYTVFNDWTARSIQKQEMTMPLGPAKGKDFANAFGPCIVTKDEFEKYRCTISKKLHPKHLKMPTTTGNRFDVKMTAKINGEIICEGNYKTAYWTFPQMIERASRNNVSLLPGDILGSGTVGWGSLIENAFSVHRPIEPGDVVELEIEGIGVLRNTVI
ncbi:MAG: fumarylacetoacetate hydrolase family protein [Saprospiraceae bacterium]